MVRSYFKFSILVIAVISQALSWCPPNPNVKFKQKTDRFWEFDEKTNTWVELKLPFDLKSCVDGNCTVVGRIEPTEEKETEEEFKRKSFKIKEDGDKAAAAEESSYGALPIRKRVSITKMSEASIWVTGLSGSIYERFWNGIQWVIAPHDLPISAGFAVAVFIINQTIFTLSEAGSLYQLQLGENSQPFWTEFMPSKLHGVDTQPSTPLQIKSGTVSPDGERLYFTTMNGLLLELAELWVPRWINHGQPPGGDVASIADAASVRPDVVFTVSSTGELYEFDKSSKPSWKKHIWSEASMRGITLMASLGCGFRGLSGPSSLSIFLLVESGNLMERRLHQRKWKWIVHRAPEGQNLTAITPAAQNDLNEKVFSLFLTTATGLIFEYQLPINSGPINENKIHGTWVNHMHPPHAKAARAIPGVQLQVGRMVFPLDDGRLAELHLLGIGGESSGPAYQINTKRKSLYKYEWSVHDAPETEGWNAEYCTDERGPSNCIVGMIDTLGDDGDEANELSFTTPTRRRKGQGSHHYLSSVTNENGQDNTLQQNNVLTNGINTNFRMRAMQAERSFFLITDSGVTYEHIYIENVWIWLRHDHSTTMEGVLGSYNGSLFLVDIHGNLLIRERDHNELSWINCTAMRKGRKVAQGPPWDGIPGKARKVTEKAALFFVDRNGRLLQLTVALRKFKWKDCQKPPNTKIASIVDQEALRSNIVFVIGRNGRLYQYNKVTELWHEHYQSPHLVLSRLPGAAARPSWTSLTGSLFMLSEDGGLVEYHWNVLDAWKWVEHGTPNRNVTLIAAPGPCFDGNQLFLIGSDGNVYLRYLEYRTWKWKNYGFPSEENIVAKLQNEPKGRDGTNEQWNVEGFTSNYQKLAQNLNDWKKHCDEKVAPIRPIPLSVDSVIFELRDGRLAELRRIDGMRWGWSRTIGTPTSLCIQKFWTALAS